MTIKSIVIGIRSRPPTNQPYYDVHGMTNLSLGVTTKNVTPQTYETHSTSEQHRTHIKKAFHSKFFIKKLPNSCKIQNST
jgi:hypothetical protein